MEKFNVNIWEELLSLKKKNEIKLSRRWIAKRFSISDREASYYWFAIHNLDNITKNLELLKRVFSKEKELSKFKKMAKDQIKEILELENAIATFIQLKDSVDKISYGSMPKEQIDSDTTAIALLSDAHVEERIDPKVVNSLNEYNESIAAQRMKSYFSRLMWMIRSSRKGGFDIKHLVLAILGDMITGYIHEELVENNYLSPIEATMFAQELLIEGLVYLSKYGEFETITVPMLRGNHGRTTARKRYSTGYKNSYEWLMYKNIERWLSQHGYNNIRTIIPNSEFQVLKIYDKTWCFSHGDHFNYRGGVGGITIPFMGWMKRMLRVLPADKYAIGHWHTSINLPMGVINGSVIGYSPYAMGKALEPEPPQQSLMIQDKKRGIVRIDPIILTDWK